MAQRFAPIHDQLVARLAPLPGETWLDVATGTGGVAIRAAVAGAKVTGSDIAPGMLDGARAKAPDIDFELGDVQALRYDDASFEVVSSCFGFIFAPDHEATARELTRVCGGRLGFTAWEPHPKLRDLYDRFDLEAPEGRHPFEWGKTGHVDELLGEAFQLDVEHQVWHLEGTDGEEMWQFWSRSAPPFRAMLAELDRQRLDEFHAAYVEFAESYREGDRVRVPREYVLVLGTRR
jgi:ubiquinone/menaquinone biosynthesis C-methylase UbiE